MPRPPAATLTGPYAPAARWVAAACGLVAALALLEVISRLEGPTLCIDDTAALLAADPEVGWTFAPGLTAAVGVCRGAAAAESWRATLTVNRDGLADQEWDLAKRPGEVRVIVLGNERADGVGLDRADRLSVRLAHLADQIRGARVSGINAAIPKYTLADAQRWLVRRGVRYSPDVVVLVLDPLRDVAAALDPPAVEAVPATLPPASGLLSWSGAARWWSSRPAVAPARSVRIGEPRTPASEAEWARARERAVAAIAELAAASRAMGATFAVVVAPPCPPAPYDAGLCAAIAPVAPCADLAESFAQVRAQRGDLAELCIPGTGRWGRDGHFLASHQVWTLLDQSGLWPSTVRRGHRL